MRLVAVDNGSTDGTSELARSYADVDSRIKFLGNEKNYGPVINWWKGIEAVETEWYKLLFSDDILHPDCLSSFLQTLKRVSNEEINAVFCKPMIGGSNNIHEFVNYKKVSNPIRPNLISANHLILGMMVNKIPVSPCAYFFRKRCIRCSTFLGTDRLLSVNSETNIKEFLRNGAGADVDLILAHVQGSKAAKTEDRTVFFRAHDGSFTVGKLKHSVRRNYALFYLIYSLEKRMWFGLFLAGLRTTRLYIQAGRFARKKLILMVKKLLPMPAVSKPHCKNNEEL
jgi:glycosyltransferase involved in cell wall biosynthesis